jgi:hypothetical protein
MTRLFFALALLLLAGCASKPRLRPMSCQEICGEFSDSKATRCDKPHCCEPHENAWRERTRAR